MAAALELAGHTEGTATVPLGAAAATMADRTEVMPPVRSGTHVAPPRRPGWVVPAVALAVLAILLAVLVPALVAGGGGSATPLKHPTKPGGHVSHRPSNAATPPTSAPPTTQPVSPTPPAASSVLDAAGAVGTAVSDALAAGLIDDHTAGDVVHGLDEAVKKFDGGDAGKALDEITQTKDKLAQAVDRGDATPEAATAIGSTLDRLAATMVASTPTSGSNGDGPPGKDHGNGHGGNDHGD
jgi:hypothetical protein